jgi:hypothetical protein
MLSIIATWASYSLLVIICKGRMICPREGYENQLDIKTDIFLLLISGHQNMLLYLLKCLLLINKGE